MTRPIVLIAEELSPATMAALGPDFDVKHVDGTDRAALLAAVSDASAILVRSATQVDAEVFAAAKQLKVVARAGVGLDNVDVAAATQAGVMVVNAPTSNIVSAAELAVGLLIALARHIPAAHASLVAGEWKRSKFNGIEIADKTLGVIGFGRIGMLVAQRLSAFGVSILAYDPYVQPARAAQLGVRVVPLEELLRESDFITVHLPKTADTVNLIGKAEFEMMKDSALLINAARGGIVNEAELYEALKAKKIAGAGLDVYAKEPCTDSPLFTLPNVVATPHLGASTDEAQEKAGIAVARSVRLALAGELVPDAVNVQGGVIADLVKPLLPLTEALGQIAASLTSKAIEQVSVEYIGEAHPTDINVLEVSALKGVFTNLVHDPVSYVNAPVLAKDRGVASSVAVVNEETDHRTLVRVVLTLTDGDRVVVAGTVTAPNDKLKLVQIDQFEVDAPIATHMAFFKYHDRPGVVAILGRILGDAQINIAGMQVSRDTEGVHAMVALTLDSAVSVELAEQISTEIGGHTGRVVSFIG
ncbi:unannotated protein [freshwater metagenome]|uniref:phosphoglycerate dehydrogenase n=1 Tax=freshwater metagenome TaxID=449393 RepID=A0A6J6ENI3_9ZZZZ